MDIEAVEPPVELFPLNETVYVPAVHFAYKVIDAVGP